MALRNAAYWIARLQLTQHIEGGWYNEVYRSDLALEHLPSSFPGKRKPCS